VRNVVIYNKLKNFGNIVKNGYGPIIFNNNNNNGGCGSGDDDGC
jgi:hypothetical protein